MLSLLHRRARLHLPIFFAVAFVIICLLQIEAFRGSTTATARDYFNYGSSLLNPTKAVPSSTAGDEDLTESTVTRVGGGPSGVPFRVYMESLRAKVKPTATATVVAAPSPITSQPPAAETTGTRWVAMFDDSARKGDEGHEEGDSDAPSSARTKEAEQEQPSDAPDVVPVVAPAPADPTNAPQTNTYISSILDPSSNELPRLTCQYSIGARYNHLKPSSTASPSVGWADNGTIKYFLALDLFEVEPLLPRLMGSILEVIRHLGPPNCALSIVEGRSKDKTYDILAALKPHLEAMGTPYTLTTSGLDPKFGPINRIEALADLRNQALAPLTEHPELYDPEDTTVLFLNDIAVCPHDILEVIHQHVTQSADMTCAMDWTGGGGSFYDVWVSRGLNGDTFFDVPQDASWRFSENLFWNDLYSKEKYEKKEPFQVYACWNGFTAFTATPLLTGEIKFRSAKDPECFMGEPTLFCKDLWRKGKGRIQVVPSVNVGYTDQESVEIKERRGYVERAVDVDKEQEEGAVKVQWQKDPPGQVKCLPEWERPSWVPPV